MRALPLGLVDPPSAALCQSFENCGKPDVVARPFKRFQCRGPDNKPPPKIHKVGMLVAGKALAPSPPQELANKLAECMSIVAIGVETHELVSGNTKSWRQSSLGLRTTVAQEQIDVLRVIQVGWAKGHVENAPR